MRRGDLAKSRFLAWVLVYAADYVRDGMAVADAVEAAFGRTYDESEHGGTGIGRATCRRARREAAAWIELGARMLGARLLDTAR